MSRQRTELGVEAATILASQWNVPLAEVLATPPTLAEKSIELRLAWEQFATAFMAPVRKRLGR
jgi:hypothetical protein